MTERILFVDDEPKILEAYKRNLRKNFIVIAASGGTEALRLMETDGPFPVVVSDMQMPEMNGVQLLLKIKQQYPDTIRLMVTGNADQKTAVDAINTSDVFRFINKPCAPDKMIVEINAALRHFQLLKAEQDLLENTLKGSIKALVEILSIVSPKIFGRAETVRNYVVKCAKIMGVKKTWELEATALLSQIGVVTLPETAFERAINGKSLSADEQMAYEHHPEIGANLIDKIPRLENISTAIRWQNKSFSGSENSDGKLTGENLPLESRLLKVVLDFVSAESSGLSNEQALKKLLSHKQDYDPKVLSALATVLDKKPVMKSVELPVEQLTQGMTIANNIVTSSGALLVGKGQEISPSMVARLVNFRKNNEIPEKLTVLVKNTVAENGR